MRQLSILGIATVLLGHSGCGPLFTAPPLVGPETVAEADAVGDPELIADVGQLANKGFRPGSGEAKTQLCVQQYVKARVGLINLSNAENALEEQAARSEMEGRFGNCKQYCGEAANTPSPYSELAGKYARRCTTGVSDANEALQTDELAGLVATLRNAGGPLALFIADQNVAASLEQLRRDGVSNETIERLEAEANALGEANADAIEIGRAFTETPEAQAKAGEREAIGRRQREIEAEIVALEQERREAVEAGLVQRAASLDREIAALVERLTQTIEMRQQLSAEYESMAKEAGA